MKPQPAGKLDQQVANVPKTCGPTVSGQCFLGLRLLHVDAFSFHIVPVVWLFFSSSSSYSSSSSASSSGGGGGQWLAGVVVVW